LSDAVSPRRLRFDKAASGLLRYRHEAAMRRLLRLFNDLPIARKLVLASVIPVVAVALLSVVTYRSVTVFSDDEEQLNNTYLVQRRAAEYMRLILDLETGFRGYVLTKQEHYLYPFRTAQERILSVGDSLEQMLHGQDEQRALIGEVQRLVKQLVNEKDELIQAVKSGHPENAVHYMESGRGRAVMLDIRQLMARFDRLEQDALNSRLARISQDRSSMLWVILGGGGLAVILTILTLHMIARSITTPLASLAKAVGSSSAGFVPSLPVLERRDEIGDLTRVMHAMSAQIRDHLEKVEKSETDLRALNEVLSASESKYRSLVDHAPFGIFTTKGVDMVFSNRYNRILAGLDPDEEGDPEAVRLAYHPEDRERVLSEFAKAVEEGRPYETVFRFLHKDGTVRKVLSRRIPIRDADGRVVMYQGFNVDITVLDEMQARLLRAERLATLGQVAAGIAHEIRNPLVGIGSTTSLLLEEIKPTDPRRPDLEIILQETRRLDRIVNQIIDYARPCSIAPVLFFLPDLVQEVMKLLDIPIAEKRLAVRSSLPPTLPPLQADRDQVKQVLINLVQNAIEASEEGGVLTLASFELTRGQEAGVAIHIVDTGTGIAPEALPHVFEPFFTSGKHRGTGLGLAICRNIIDAHGGDIQLTSQPGKGTTVRVWLPLRQRPRIAET
jgi:PAS domain S-box-containing protein